MSRENEPIPEYANFVPPGREKRDGAKPAGIPVHANFYSPDSPGAQRQRAGKASEPRPGSVECKACHGKFVDQAELRGHQLACEKKK